MPAEMPRPAVSSRVEQAGELSCLRVNAGKVGAFVEVAAETGIGKIAEFVSTTMLFGDDMFNLKRREDMGIRKLAVFASSSRALADLFLDSFVHPWLSEISAGAIFVL